MKFEIREVKVMSQIIKQIVMVGDDKTEWFIPADPANSDYQAYLVWVAEQKEIGKI